MTKTQWILSLWMSFWLALAGGVLAMSLAMMSMFSLAATVLAWIGGVVSVLLIQQVQRVRAEHAYMRLIRDGSARKRP